MEAMRKILLVGSICLLVLGCGSISEQKKSSTINARVNTVIKFDDALLIEVKSVSDSRCPKGCQCIWAGEVSVSINLSDGVNRIDTCVVLPTNPIVKFTDYSIELIDVSPYPVCGNQFPSDYIYTFQVSVLRSV
jgi:hypothetical protein